MDQMEFKIGQILECRKVEGSNKLLRSVVDLGEEKPRIVFSGIAKHYEPEDLINKKTVYVTNVEPRPMMGEMSEAMIFAASDDKDLSILLLEKDLPVGTKVY